MKYIQLFYTINTLIPIFYIYKTYFVFYTLLKKYCSKHHIYLYFPRLEYYRKDYSSYKIE